MTRRRFALGAGAALIGPGSGWVARAAAGAAAFAEALARIEAGLDGRLGVAVRDAGSGGRWGHRADERFPLCSTFKVLACGAVLSRVDAGREDLGRRIRFTPAEVVTYSPVTKDRTGGDGMTLEEICTAAMTRSDNTAANLVLASLGGPSAVTAFARSIGDPATRLDRIETALNAAVPGDPRDTTTPDAMAADIEALALGTVLSERSRTRLTAWMAANETGGSKLRAGVPKDWRVGDRTGGGDFGTVNDVAVVRPPERAPLVVCAYVTQTTASFDACNAAIAAVGRAVAALLPG